METAVGTALANGLANLMMRQENLYLVVATYVLLNTFFRILPPALETNVVLVRLIPVFPILLCSAGVWFPGQQPAGMTAGDKVMIGLILGYVCGHMHKFWMQTVMGQDSRLNTPATRVALPALPQLPKPTMQVVVPPIETPKP